MLDAKALEAPQSQADYSWRPFWQPLLIALLPFILIVGCWKADFVGYDDPMHVSENKQILEPLSRILEFNPDFPYFPVSLLTYKIDYFLFAGWMPAWLGSWAPGVRLMSVVYHVLAALVVWRIFLLLKVSRSKAFFIACAFAIHPLASETVCWTSERKNAVAGLLGFLAVWAWIKWEGTAKGIILGTLLFGVALLAKQSVLGLLPLLILFELFGGTRGLAGEAPTYWKPGMAWARIAVRSLAPALAALAMVAFTLHIMVHTIVPPPGGSIVTALLTDLEILSRDIFSLTIPVHLSAVYLVDPVRSWQDNRILPYGLILAGLIGVSVRYAQNRRLALFGWLWFVGSLGPNLNLVSIPHLMQDRYLYLGTPGFFLVVVEFVSGLAALLKPRLNFPAARVGMIAATAYLALLALLSFQRSAVWISSRTIFEDAVGKEPLAAYARYGLGQTYKDMATFYSSQATPQASNAVREAATKGAEAYRRENLRQWAIGIACPDTKRFNMYMPMALELGYESVRLNQPVEAERYWSLCIERPTETIDDPNVRSEAMGSLSALWLDQGKYAKAYALSKKAQTVATNEPLRILVARTASALATELQRNEADKLLNEARELLKAVKPDSTYYGAAQAYLNQPPLKRE